MKLSLSALYQASGELMEFGISLKDYGSTRLNQVNCPKCDKELSWEYMQGAVYLISCPDCKIVHLVKAKSLSEALGQIGTKEPCADTMCSDIGKLNYTDLMKVLMETYHCVEKMNKES